MNLSIDSKQQRIRRNSPLDSPTNFIDVIRYSTYAVMRNKWEIKEHKHFRVFVIVMSGSSGCVPFRLARLNLCRRDYAASLRKMFQSASMCMCVRTRWRGFPRKIRKPARRLCGATCNAWRKKAEMALHYIITSGSNARWIDDYKSGEIKGSSCSASWEHRTPSQWPFALWA